MRGRYTRFLSDGLPLFGEQVSLGLMQIPPLDLARAYQDRVANAEAQLDDHARQLRKLERPPP